MRFAGTPIAALLLAALPVAGQETVLPELFSDVIDVRVVNVEAVVTDRKGNRIRGLTANDFELLVDGEPAPIAYFTEIDEGIVRAGPATGVEIAEAVPALNAGEPVGTNFLVFIDDEDHKVEVRVNGRPELRVRSRRSYLDMSRSTEVTMLVEGALLFGGSPGAELLGVRLGSPERARSRKILVPMEIAIPLEHVQLLPIAGRWTNELEFRVTVIDEDGNRSETPVEKILISGPSKPEPGDVFYYETNLLLRRREHRFVAAVYDPLTGAILSTSGSVGP